MKLNLVNVTTFAIGTVLVYSAVKDKDPRDVVKKSLARQSPAGAATIPSSAKKSDPVNPTTPAAPIPASAAALGNGQLVVS